MIRLTFRLNLKTLCLDAFKLPTSCNYAILTYLFTTQFDHEKQLDC